MIWHMYHKILLFCEIDVTRNASLDGTGEHSKYTFNLVQKWSVYYFKVFCFETRLCFVNQAGLKLTILLP